MSNTEPPKKHPGSHGTAGAGSAKQDEHEKKFRADTGNYVKDQLTQLDGMCGARTLNWTRMLEAGGYEKSVPEAERYQLEDKCAEDVAGEAERIGSMIDNIQERGDGPVQGDDDFTKILRAVEAFEQPEANDGKWRGYVRKKILIEMVHARIVEKLAAL